MSDVRVLGPQDRPVVDALLAVDPVVHGFVASRVEAGLLLGSVPGELWGFPAQAPTALLHVGANLVPVQVTAAACDAFVRQMGQSRPFLSIVGPSDEVLMLWSRLCAESDSVFAHPHAVRAHQPFMVTDQWCPIEADDRVKPVTLRHEESYVRASAAMYLEELGQDPMKGDPDMYRRYVRSLITSGRAFAVMDGDEVVFKADVSAVSSRSAQVQGVWIHPALRGRGLAAGAVAAVTHRILASGRVASLYVNDFNAPALATYRRCGYGQHTVFTSVLYEAPVAVANRPGR